jgi:hypothetical protein
MNFFCPLFLFHHIRASMSSISLHLSWQSEAVYFSCTLSNVSEIMAIRRFNITIFWNKDVTTNTMKEN